MGEVEDINNSILVHLFKKKKFVSDYFLYKIRKKIHYCFIIAI